MKNNNTLRSPFPIILSIGALLFLFIFSKCYTSDKSTDLQSNLGIKNKTAVDSKQKGAHLFGYIDSASLQPLIQNNFEWITLVSYAGQKDIASPDVNYHNGDSLRLLRRDSMWKKQIDLAHRHGFKVFLKPHIWLHSPADGKWRSDIFPGNDSDWKQWQKSYREFILHYANMAQQSDVELFCIGTELSRLTVEKSDYWKSLIQEVRGIYSGEITYAANWYNEYEEITFWDDLDYIGIQAYFPLVKNKHPTVKQISAGWNKYLSDIESIHKKYNRKILFTEMGYKSTADSAITPWQWVEHSSNPNELICTETQANCYEAFFNSVWNKEWFGGVHIWQLRSDFVRDRGMNNFDFTPQGKPAETVIARGFK